MSLDTTRADHLGCYGSAAAKTPFIDSMARHGILFRDASTAATTTLAAHTSIMTGLYPQSHGVPENGWIVAKVNTMLAEILHDAGYHTEAVIGSFALSPEFGMAQGFDHFDERFDLLLHPRYRDQNQRRAADVTDAAIQAIDRRGDKPLFLFVHYFDAHAPYDPPADPRGEGGAKAAGESGPADGTHDAAEAGAAGSLRSLEALRALVARHQRESTGKDLGGLRVVFDGLTTDLIRGATGEPGSEDLQMDRLYSGEIAYVDRELRRLFDALEKRGILDSAVVVILADHGETLWEHGDYYNHGLAVYQTTVHVPLIVRLPGDRDAGRSVSVPVSTVDVLPTLLDLLALPHPRRLDGVSLAGLLDGGGSPERGPVFTTATQPADPRFDRPGAAWRDASRARAIRDGRWKLIETPYLGDSELYDLSGDPGERRDLLHGKAPAPAAALRAERRLRRRLDQWAASADPLPSFPSRRNVEEIRERLRALGYL